MMECARCGHERVLHNPDCRVFYTPGDRQCACLEFEARVVLEPDSATVLNSWDDSDEGNPR